MISYILLGRFQHTGGMYCLHFRFQCSHTKEHDRSYCKLLSDVFKEAKRLNCDTHIINLNNTIKTMWEIVMLETGRKAYNDNIHSLNVDGTTMISNQQTIAGTFNNYFLSVAKNVNVNNTHSNINDRTINDSFMKFMSNF
jgi:hypothetical protein